MWGKFYQGWGGRTFGISILRGLEVEKHRRIWEKLEGSIGGCQQMTFQPALLYVDVFSAQHFFLIASKMLP